VRYQLDQILSEDFPEDVLNALEKLPTDLSEAYTAILERIKAKKGLDSAYLIFSWVFHMPHPIRMGELIEALSVQKGNTDLNPKLFMSPSKLLGRCEGLIMYNRMSDEVRFAHFTVFEYLQKYHENILSKPVELATVSLKYLRIAAHRFREEYTVPVSDLFALKFHETACLYWGWWAAQGAIDNLEFWESLLKLHESPRILQKLHQTLQCPGAIGTQTVCHSLCTRFTILHLLAVGNLASFCEVLFDVACSKDLNRLPKPLVDIADRISAMAKSCQTNINNVCDRYGSALHIATDKDDDQLFRLLISHRADLNIKCSSWGGLRPIHLAAQSSSISKLEFLHTQGADLNILDHHGRPPLHHAILYGRETSCVKLLLSKGCVLSGKKRSGSTPIHVAAQSGNIEILQLVVDAYPTLARSDRDRYGCTPLHYACQNEDSRTLKFLLSLPETDPSSMDQNGITPLHTTAQWGNIESTKLLLEAGADHTIVNSFGTPLDLALMSGNIDVARVISDHTRTLNDSQGFAPNSGEWLPIQYLLSRIQENPEKINYYDALARLYLREGNVEMAYQYFDRYTYLTGLPFSFPFPTFCRLCSRSIRSDREALTTYVCSSCPPLEHGVCEPCFRLLSAYSTPKYFTDHVFVQIPSKQYPASISDFIEWFKAKRPALHWTYLSDIFN
jgi:ankyrin repeat protein